MKGKTTYQEHPEIVALKERYHGNTHALLVLVQSEPDYLHRQKFTMYWWADNVGHACNEQGWRGQCFHAVLCEHIMHDHQWRTIEFVYNIKNN